MTFKSKPDGERVDYILDGQQRITSLYACMKGETIKYKNKVRDFSQIWIDLDASYEDQIVTTDPKVPNKILLTDLLKNRWKVDEKYADKVNNYYDDIAGFQFPITTILQSPTNVATEIFTRLNVGGKSLTVYEIMCAATYDPEFDLQDKYDELKKSLQDSNYFISDSQLLQLISIILTHKDGHMGGCSNKFILNLNKQEFISIWDEVVNNIKSAVDHLKKNLCPTYNHLPYPGLIVLFAYFYNKSKTMSHTQKIYLDDLFWRISLGNRYGSGLESKLIQDISKVDQILEGNLPKYEWSLDITPDNILKTAYFNKNSASTKAWMCLLALQGPKSLRNNTLINIDGTHQLVKNSPNLHHFFPKNYLKEMKHEDSADHVLNMTIIDDSLNKHISDKVPNVYMGKLLEENPDLSDTLKTHLIGSVDGFGIMDNDYVKFKKERAVYFSRAIGNLIQHQETGNEFQDVEDLIEEEILED
jgi:hypothetical protein